MTTLTTFLSTSPIGCLKFSLTQAKLSSLQFLLNKKPAKQALDKNSQAILNEIKSYFKNPKHNFSLALHLKGTAFQQSVWKALEQIPCGQVRTYQQLALQLKTSPRAIGNACRANPVPVIIPCHRVVAKKSRGGYNGETGGKMLAIKEWLLAHEQASN